MSEPRLDVHGSDTVKALFDEDTSEIHSVGDIVDKHAGDSLILTPATTETNNVDDGEAEFEDDLLPEDPSEKWESVDDSFPGTGDEDEEGIGETDITGTAPGIARGFGSHLPLDYGSDGFQIEEIPGAVAKVRLIRGENEELDDYDDTDTNNGKFDSKSLADFEEPGDNEIDATEADEARAERPATFDEQIDSSFR
jgi:hypothetical protein